MEHKHRKLAIWGICIGVFVLSLDWSIVSNALPAIQKSLNTSLSALQWVMNAFGLVMTVFLVTMGRLADAFGRKKVFSIGLWIGMVAALGAAISPFPNWLIACRAFQGLAASIVVPASQSLITHAYPEKDHGKAIAIWMTMIGAGLSCGPVVSGIILQFLTWHWIFYLNLPLLLISFIFTKLAAQESRNEDHPAKIDIPGLVLLTVGLSSLVFGLIEAPNFGWGSSMTIGLFILSALAFVAFAIVEWKTTYPVLQIHFFRNRQFLAGCLAKFSVVFLVWGVFFMTPLYLQTVRGDSPAISGVLMLCITLSFTITARFTGVLSEKFDRKYLIWGGSFLVVIAMGLMSFLQPETPIVTIILFFILLGFGWGAMSPPSTAMGIAAIPRNQVGVASGTVVTMQELGGTVGMAVIGTLFRMEEMKKLSEKLYVSKLGLSHETIEKILSAFSNPNREGSVLSYLPESLQNKLHGIFQEAFMHGYSHALWVCGGVMLASLCIIVLLVHKESPPLHRGREKR